MWSSYFSKAWNRRLASQRSTRGTTRTVLQQKPFLVAGQDQTLRRNWFPWGNKKKESSGNIQTSLRSMRQGCIVYWAKCKLKKIMWPKTKQMTYSSMVLPWQSWGQGEIPTGPWKTTTSHGGWRTVTWARCTFVNQMPLWTYLDIGRRPVSLSHRLCPPEPLICPLAVFESQSSFTNCLNTLLEATHSDVFNEQKGNCGQEIWTHNLTTCKKLK